MTFNAVSEFLLGGLGEGNPFSPENLYAYIEVLEEQLR